MTKVTLEVEGLDRLHRAMQKAPREVDRGIQAAMTGGVEILREGVATYPEETDANIPQPGVPGARWYERGRGGWYVRKRTGETVNYGGSEVLGKSWTTKISRTTRGWLGVIGTKVSYARPVHDEAQQTWYHKQTGWKTAQQSVREGAAKVARVFNATIRVILRRLRL